MPNKLPTNLNKEPLIDAIFELRFSTQAPASSILTGIFFNNLEGEKTIEPLGNSAIPKQIRDTDPNMQFSPLVKIHWKEFFLLIGEKSIAVACKLPYPKWTKFKKAIKEVIQTIQASKYEIDGIQRYSLKYIDLIPVLNMTEPISSILNIDISLGTHKLSKETFQLKIEQPSDKLIHIVEIMSNAQVTMIDRIDRHGIAINIDTICIVDNQKFDDFLINFDEKIDNIHSTNKDMFFKCITPKTLNELEPVYD